jgi:predicted nucleic acid-binding protein
VEKIVLDTNCLMQIISTKSPDRLVIEPHYKWLLLPDPDDNKFVDCAISANARYVVSDDKHFKILKNKDTWPHIDLKTLKEYHKHLLTKKS